jgi:hypothetical protein
MNLKLTITVVDELADDEIRAVGELDLASGDISIVRYEDYDVVTQGLPVHHKTTSSRLAFCPTAAATSNSACAWTACPAGTA